MDTNEQKAVSNAIDVMQLAVEREKLRYFAEVAFNELEDAAALHALNLHLALYLDSHLGRVHYVAEVDDGLAGQKGQPFGCGPHQSRSRKARRPQLRY